MAARQRHLGYLTLIIAGLVGSCLELLAGLSGGLLTFAAAILPIAAAAVLIDTTVSTRVQLDTRGDMRGRVLAALAMTSALSSAMGAQLLGWMSQDVGPRATLVAAGVVTTAVCVVAGVMLSRRLHTSEQPAGLARTVLAGVRDAAIPQRLGVPGRLAMLARPRTPEVPGQPGGRSAGPRVAGRSAVHPANVRVEETATPVLAAAPE
jgi:MFS family permease